MWGIVLKDYNKVLKFLLKLNDYSLRTYNLNLYEIDINKYDCKSVLEFLYDRSDYDKKFRLYKKEVAEVLYKNSESDISYLIPKYFPDIDLSRKIKDMSDDDLFNLINLTYSNQYGDFLIIRYNEIKIFNNKIVGRQSYSCYDKVLREMRSIVVDIRNFKVVSLPFYKFMNIGESVEYTLPSILNRLSTANLVEYADKADGSFIQATCIDKNLYSFYPYDTLLSTSKNVRNTEIYKAARTWYEANLNYKNLVYAYPEWTVMFEWISLEDRHIVVYNKSQCGLYLIGMRHKETGVIKPYYELQQIANNFNVRVVDTYSGTFDEIRDSLSLYKSNEKEGYVMNIDGFLVKLKCTDYLDMVSLLKSEASPNTVIRAISNNSVDDLLSRLPDGHRERALWYADEVYEYLDLMNKIVDGIVSYLFSLNLPLSEVGKWCNKVPKMYRGSVKNIYFTMCNKGYKPDINYLTVSPTKGTQGFISMTELRRRVKLLKSFDMNNISNL